MEKYYTFNPKLKKQMLKKWRESHKGYRIWRVVMYVSYAIAILAFITGYFCMLVVLQDIVDPADKLRLLMLTSMSVTFGMVLALIPFVTGMQINVSAKKKYGRPYSYMTQEFLYSNDTGIQFGFRHAEDKDLLEYPERMHVYQISYADINCLDFDESFNTVTITGIGEYIVYDNFMTLRKNYTRSIGELEPDSTYSFILAFDEQEEFLDLIKSKTNWAF